MAETAKHDPPHGYRRIGGMVLNEEEYRRYLQWLKASDEKLATFERAHWPETGRRVRA